MFAFNISLLILLVSIASVLCENHIYNRQHVLKSSDDFMKELVQEYESFFMSERNNSARIKSVLNIFRQSNALPDTPYVPYQDARLVKCLACRSTAAYFLTQRRRGASKEGLAKQAVTICNLVTSYSPDVCRGLVDLNMDIALFIVDARPSLTGITICSLLLQGECGDLDKSLDFKVNISPKSPASKIRRPKRSSVNLKILHFTDFHYDPSYLPGGNAKCSQPLCCRVTSGNATNEKNKAGVYGDYRECDMPFATIENAVKSAAQQHPDADLIYYTGDSVDHSVWATSIETNKGIMAKVDNLFAEVFKNIPVYQILGNHEAHPVNIFAPKTITEESLSTRWLYDYSAELWEKWLSDDALKTVKSGGYYTELIKPGLRLIALNNNDCNIYNFWILYSVDEVGERLQWLHDTLLMAEENDEKVHILAHIGSGEGSCFKYWAREYRRIIERFKDTVTGQFNGHSHYDEFNVYYEKNNVSNAINVAWNGGSVTTYYNLNPNYIVYSLDAETYHVDNFESWIFNLTEANLNAELPPQWTRQYSFRETFSLPNLLPESLDKLLANMSSDRKLAHKYFQFKVKAGDPYLKAGCKDRCLKEHLCAIATTETGDDEKCRKLLQIKFT